MFLILLGILNQYFKTFIVSISTESEWERYAIINETFYVTLLVVSRINVKPLSIRTLHNNV